MYTNQEIHTNHKIVIIHKATYILILLTFIVRITPDFMSFLVKKEYSFTLKNNNKNFLTSLHIFHFRFLGRASSEISLVQVKYHYSFYHHNNTHIDKFYLLY